MRDLLGKEQRPASVLGGSLGITQKPQVHGGQRHAADARVVPAISEGVRGVLYGAVQSETALDLLPAGGKFAEPRKGAPCGVMGFESQVVVVCLIRQSKQ